MSRKPFKENMYCFDSRAEAALGAVGLAGIIIFIGWVISKIIK
jgi:hypothetical protein